jgi:hypothetical protein
MLHSATAPVFAQANPFDANLSMNGANHDTSSSIAARRFTKKSMLSGSVNSQLFKAPVASRQQGARR